LRGRGGPEKAGGLFADTIVLFPNKGGGGKEEEDDEVVPGSLAADEKRRGAKVMKFLSAAGIDTNKAKGGKESALSTGC